MAGDQYNLSDKSRKVLQDTVRRVRAGNGSTRPTPTRRTPRTGGGGQRIQLAKATSSITAATSMTSRGSGTVQFVKNSDGSNDGDPVTIANPFFDAFDNSSVLWCNRSVDPPLIVSVGCTVAS